MTFVPFNPKYNKNDVVALREEMVSYKTNKGGIFSKGHEFKITSLYVQNNINNVRFYGTLQPASELKQNTVPYVYCLEDTQDPQLTCQAEERDIRLIKRGDPDEKPERLVYSRVGKEKTTHHAKPRKDAPDSGLKKELSRLDAKEAKPNKSKLSLSIGKKK